MLFLRVLWSFGNFKADALTARRTGCWEYALFPTAGVWAHGRFPADGLRRYPLNKIRRRAGFAKEEVLAGGLSVGMVVMGRWFDVRSLMIYMSGFFWHS